MTTVQELQRLINLVDDKVAALPKQDWRDEDSRRAHRDALNSIFRALEADEGAKTGDGSGSTTHLRMAGIKTSSTCGEIGALQNWKCAAEKRIAALQEAGHG